MRSICVEGNIGAGKSTVLQRLEGRGIDVRYEPLDAWGPLLEMYYSDPARWSLTFNLKVLHGFWEHAQNVPPENAAFRVIERSPGACRHVFGQLSYNDNHLSPAAWNVFKEYHELLGWEPSAYVYIDTPVDMCLDRIRRRDRTCERSLTDEYLRRIEFQYTNFLKFADVPVLRLDGTKTPDDLADAIVRFAVSSGNAS